MAVQELERTGLLLEDAKVERLVVHNLLEGAAMVLLVTLLKLTEGREASTEKITIRFLIQSISIVRTS